MVMNHYKRPKSFYVRTKVWYTTEKRTPAMPTVIADFGHGANAMACDVPGGGRKGSNFVSSSDWTVPEGFKGRLLLGVSHQHGGAKDQTLASRTSKRPIYKARAYHGRPNHPYNTIRPILPEPGPIGNGTFATAGFTAFDGNALTIGDDFFRPGKVTTNVGELVCLIHPTTMAQTLEVK